MYDLYGNSILYYFAINLFQKKAELHCTKCSLMACPICHLDKHQSHEFMIFKDLSHERKIRLSETLLGLKY